MRRTLPLALVAAIAAIGISACSSTSNAANAPNAADANAAASDNAASAAPADAGTSAAPPVYPGAAEGTRPKGVADDAPSTVKAYLTPDGMAVVRTWYKAHLKGAQEIGAPDNGKGKDKDVFLVGQGATGQVVMLQSLGGKTWVVIGPTK